MSTRAPLIVNCFTPRNRAPSSIEIQIYPEGKSEETVHRYRCIMKPLVVNEVNFYPRENAKLHHTDSYELVNAEDSKVAIVRRGQLFKGKVQFTRSYDEKSDLVQLVFTLGDSPAMATMGSMYLKRDAVVDKHAWSAKLTDVQKDTLYFEISTPVDVPVGCWALYVITRIKNSPAKEIYNYDQELYILFNPWNPEDQTYMEDSALLQEYVLNDVGKVWMGPVRTGSGKPWVFGQFDTDVLRAVMFMLHRSNMPLKQRGDPIRLCRTISKMVNANDEDGGILIGNWSGKYEDATAPFNWTGSVDIMQEYLKMNRSVAYGQCWVFACVTTTVCRALGIPSRLVTNVVSAHDTDCSLSIDKYYNEAMNDTSGDDSIWNFHVWNDVWMARPDLPSGYGGWQAIDATPQEKSEGKCQCGPASLEAIKKGELGMNYDVAFVLASVNADVLRWRKDPYSELGYSVVETSKDYVGQMVLTKKPLVFDPLGDEDCEDITDQYKYSEGSTAERVALMNGACHSERAKRCYELASKVKSDVSFKLRDIDAVNIGNDFRIVVDIDNKSEEPRNINAVLTATSVFYNGVRAEQVKTVQGKIFLGPYTHDEIVIDVTAEDYLPKLVEYCNMKISAMALVDETKQCWADDDDFRVMKPTINIKVNDNLVINQPREAFLSFLNPLDRTLTGCEFRVTSPGLAGRTVRVAAQDTLAKKRVVASLPVTPNTLGRIHIVATFTSNELKEITGAATVDVLEN
ncbi:hemocyte protein-glutamine gamma-glutamyltransferase-like [Cydia pomonella]|uniref:hemocyte protein-glutamine gamma-glutamyltransferase-like n=1 Tax=Cydia pomonella TaxID=82600 RepID=UPI002ADDA431|nr:hemocyte protein-glutamine gamma-glutamyltransferase-like [Cydia pomonella]